MAAKSSKAYADSGVNTMAGATLVERIKPAVKATRRPGFMGSLGGFAGLFDPKAAGYQDPILVAATDGVGTKLKIAILQDRHDTVGQDLVAMCVNDLIAQGAEPLFFLDYFATGQLSVDTAESVISGIANACEAAGCALIGGETAEMPGMYAPGEYDLAGFVVGAMERDTGLTPDDVQEGDVLLGLASNGIHSNGFSLVRKIIRTTQGHDYGDPCAYDRSKTWADICLMPTRLYVKPLLKILKNKDLRPALHGLAHITGGGLIENTPRMLPEGLRAVIDASQWDLPPVFGWLAEAGNLSVDDLNCTFNCGIGMIAAVAPDQADRIISVLESEGEDVRVIGHVASQTQGQELVDVTNTDRWPCAS